MPEPLTPEDVAARWRAPLRRVLALCRAGQLPTLPLGRGVYRIPLTALEAWEGDRWKTCAGSSLRAAGTPHGEKTAPPGVERCAPPMLLPPIGS